MWGLYQGTKSHPYLTTKKEAEHIYLNTNNSKDSPHNLGPPRRGADTSNREIFCLKTLTPTGWQQNFSLRIATYLLTYLLHGAESLRS